MRYKFGEKMVKVSFYKNSINIDYGKKKKKLIEINFGRKICMDTFINQY